MVDFVNNVTKIFCELCDFCELCYQMRSEVDCAKSHHRVISEGLNNVYNILVVAILVFPNSKRFLHNCYCDLFYQQYRSQVLGNIL